MARSRRKDSQGSDVPLWSAVLRALRDTAGATRDGWCVQVGYSRATIQRWESGGAVPDAAAEAAIIRVSTEYGLFRRYAHGPLAGAVFTPQALHDLLAEARAAAAANDAATPVEVVVHLPTPLTAFVGRERELADLSVLIQAARLLVITGPGGSGKTRLAIEFARVVSDSFPDGVVFIDLSSVIEAAVVPAAIALSLGLHDNARMGAPAAGDESGSAAMTRRLITYLHGRRMLLVIDNLEQVIDAATLIAELVAACPSVTILVTSRLALHVSGERLYALAPLSLPVPDEELSIEALTARAAVRLMLDRARAVRPSFILTQYNARTIAEICRRLDGLPLAIELAAARLRALTAEDLLARLTARVQSFATGPRDASTRQQTVSATIAWSYDLLSRSEQIVFERLSVFAGGFTLAGAEAVGACADIPGEHVQELLARLVDHSLVLFNPHTARYTMLETVREYAHRQLEATAAVADARTTHLRHYRRLVQQADWGLRGADQLEWLDQLELELDNFRAALSWSLETPDSVRDGLLLTSLSVLFWSSRHLREGLGWLERLMARYNGEDPRIRLIAVYATAHLAYYSQGFTTALPHLQEAVALSRQLGHNLILGFSLGLLGLEAASNGRCEEASALTEESLLHLKHVSDPWSLAMGRFTHGMSAAACGNDDAAAAAWRECEQIFRDLGDGWLIAAPIGRLGDLAYRKGDYETARRYCEESVALWRQARNKAGAAQSLASLALVALAQGNVETAERHCRESLTLARDNGSTIEIAWALVSAAGVWLAKGEPERALRLLASSDAMHQTQGIPVEAQFRDAGLRYQHDARAALEPNAADRAWSEGRALRLERAVAEALGTEGAQRRYLWSASGG